MPYGSLREFLEKAEQEGRLLRIAEEVRLEPDVRTISCAAGRMTGGPVLVFEKVRGYPDKKIVMNVHGSWENHALTLDLPKNTPVREQFREIVKRWGRYPVPAKRVTSAPGKEEVLERDFSIFRELPLFRVNPMDGGFFLSKACAIARDPENPTNQNVGIYRIQVKDHDLLGIQLSAQHDLAAYLRSAERLDVPLRVAIAVSNDPIVPFVASSPLKFDDDEYAMMGAIRGAPVEVVSSEIGALDVPAGAEMIIEGEILRHHRAVEGPFAEYPGSYSSSMLQVEIRVDRITRRRDPILFENLYTGEPWGEIDYLQGLNTCATIYNQMKVDFPEIEAVNALYTHGYCTIIASRMRFGGFAKTLACRLLSTPHGITYPKLIIVVDANVDPFNLQQVIWALTTRFRPERDLALIPNAPASTLDPAHLIRGLGTKVIIDATTPVYPDIPMEDNISVDLPADTDFWIGEIQKRMQAKP